MRKHKPETYLTKWDRGVYLQTPISHRAGSTCYSFQDCSALQAKRTSVIIESPQAKKCRCLEVGIVAHAEVVRKRNYGSNINSIWDNT